MFQRFLLTGALALGGTSVAIAQQPPTPPRDVRPPSQGTVQPTGKGSIVGSVTVTGTGGPARRARVSLSGGELRGSMSRMTDTDGKFAFVGLPAGRYTLSVSKAGYVSATYGQHRPGSGRPGTAIQLADGQKFEARLQIPRGGAITGTVVDEHGEMTQGVNVRAMRWATTTGQRTLQMVSSATTDDRGIFRIYNLQPGDYVICAAPRNQAGAEAERMLAEVAAVQRQAETAAQRSVEEARAMVERVTALQTQLTGQLQEEPAGHAPTCFPGTATPSAATSIALGPGEERGGVDFQLQLVRLAMVEGMVFSTTGSIPPNLQVTMRAAGDGVGAETRNIRVDPQGRFRFMGIAPGEYRLSARATVAATRALLDGVPQKIEEARQASGSATELRAEQRFWATTDINVDGRNVSNVVLQLQPGMTITGQIAFQGTEQRPADLTRLRANASPVFSGSVEMSSAQGRVDANGRFTIPSVLPGRYRISVSGAGPNWFTESSVVGDQDTLDFPIEVRPNQNVSDVTISFTDRQSEFTGTIVNQRNEPVSDFTVIVFPSESRYWIPQSRRIMTSRPTTDGRFTFRGLPPGEYRVATVFDPEPGSWYDPAVLQQLQSAAVTILAGEKKHQDIRISTQ